jgi:rubrerythrin
MKTLPIERLDPLPYKIPSWFFEAYTALESRDITTLQAINKNFFLFAGKWSHYITENIEFDVEEIEKELLELKEKNRLQAVEIKTLTDMVKKSKNKNSTSYECPICIEIKSNIVFNCGHIICNDCQIPLDLCPICREQITKRIKIFI